QDDAGNTVVGFGADITIALGNNPAGGTLSGTKIVTAVNGVATFSDLSIDRAGNGYTLVATATGLTGATSAPFNIAAPQVRVDVSGGGRIDPAIGKTTFGFDVDSRSGPPFKGDMQVVYHGGTSPMTRIHSVVIDGVTSSPDPRGGVCITWTGSARVNNGDQRRFTATACDNGQPLGAAVRTAATTLQSGQVTLPFGGGFVAADVDALSAPEVRVDALTTMTSGAMDMQASTAQSTAHLEKVNVLNGLITAETV